MDADPAPVEPDLPAQPEKTSLPVQPEKTSPPVEPEKTSVDAAVTKDEVVAIAAPEADKTAPSLVRLESVGGRVPARYREGQ